jgi:hypothetical protein
MFASHASKEEKVRIKIGQILDNPKLKPDQKVEAIAKFGVEALLPVRDLYSNIPSDQRRPWHTLGKAFVKIVSDSRDPASLAESVMFPAITKEEYWGKLYNLYGSLAYNLVYSTKDKPNPKIAVFALRFIREYGKMTELPELFYCYVADLLGQGAVPDLCAQLDYYYEYTLMNHLETSAYLENPLYVVRALRRAAPQGGGPHNERLIASLVRAMVLLGLVRGQVHDYFLDIGSEALPQMKEAIQHPELTWTVQPWIGRWWEDRNTFREVVTPVEALKRLVSQIEGK